jgi:hypothetical protein
VTADKAGYDNLLEPGRRQILILWDGEVVSHTFVNDEAGRRIAEEWVTDMVRRAWWTLNPASQFQIKVQP